MYYIFQILACTFGEVEHLMFQLKYVWGMTVLMECFQPSVLCDSEAAYHSSLAGENF